MSAPVRLEVLFERTAPAQLDLPEELATAWGGELKFPKRAVVANFVSSVDGVVTLAGDHQSGAVISGHDEADRLVMGLLRACADVVLIGAGTFRGPATGHWRAADAYPAMAEPFAELRKRRGLPLHPPLALVTGTGDIDPAHPALDDALIFTTPAGAAKLRSRVPAGARLLTLGPGRLQLRLVLEALRHEGLELVLTEGGPSLVGQLVEADLLDELFVTTAPVLLGRSVADGRKSLVDGVDLLAPGRPLELLSARRHHSHLLLRYALTHGPVS